MTQMLLSWRIDADWSP